MIDSVLKIMPLLNIETRRRVIVLKQAGYSFVEIKKRLGEKDIAISLQALHNLVKKYQAKNTLMDLPRHTMPRKLNSEMMAALHQALLKDDELTARKARDLLLQQWSTLQISLPTIRHVRKELGWVCTRSHYCQLIRDVSIDESSGSFVCMRKLYSGKKDSLSEPDEWVPSNLLLLIFSCKAYIEFVKFSLVKGSISPECPIQQIFTFSHYMVFSCIHGQYMLRISYM